MIKPIKRQLEVQFLLSPEQLANIFWDMDSTEQAKFFNEISAIAPNIEDQAWHISREEELHSGGREVMKKIGWYVGDPK